MIKLKTVLPNPNNPRTVNDDKFKKLVQSIKDFPKMLELRPIVVDENNIALGGNMRLKALKKLGYTEIPNNWIKRASELTDDEKRQFIIKDNVGFGDWEWDLLRADWDVDELGEWGLDLPELEDDEHIEAVEDDYSEPDNMQVDVVLGDLIEIGAHRLLCGDSTDSDLIEKLLNNKTPDLLLTDPPYGINYGAMLKGKGDGAGGSDKHGWKSHGAPEWDRVKPESGALQYLCEITTNQIIWGGNYFTDDLQPSMGWLIWDKGQRDFSLADGEMAWTSFNNALRIKSYARAKANQEEKHHPTQKPIDIISWCVEYSDRHAKNKALLILDAYLGSGSTMVAAHQLKRICYGMELDPKYCQVIIDRMLKLDSSLVVKINGEVYEPNKVKST